MRCDGDLVRRGVIVVLASNYGPSGYDNAEQHGIFAAGLLHLYRDPDAIPVRLRGRDAGAIRTIDDVRHGLGLTVRSRNKRQQAGFYVPRSIEPNSPFFGPQSQATPAVASRDGG